jgi:tetratricopeptide (TPR) repeat protein
MSRSLKEYRVFCASPGGLQRERKAFKEIIEIYNKQDAGHRGVHFVPVGWEDTLPGGGRPQAQINEEIRTCDYFLLMFWNRWGTAPDDPKNTKYTSGTEEEYYVALECYENSVHDLSEIVLLFKGVARAQMADPGPELSQVIKFRIKVESERKFLYKSFDSQKTFEDTLRGLLAKWVRDHESGEAGRKVALPPPDAPLPLSKTELLKPDPDVPVSESVTEAWALAESGKFTEAEAAFARAAAAGDDLEAFRSYGAFLLLNGRAREAEGMFRHILKLNPSDLKWKAIAYGNLGLALDIGGDLAGAKKNHEKSLLLNEELGRRDGVAQAQNNLSVIAQREGNFEVAEQLLNSALDNGRSVDRADIVGRALNNLGLVYRTKREFESAKEMFVKALATAEEIGNEQSIVNALANWATLDVDQGRDTEAEDKFSRAYALSRKIGFREGVSKSATGLAAILLNRGEFDRAQAMFAESLHLALEMGQPDLVAGVRTNLGVLAARRGNYAEAAQHLQEALAIYRHLREPVGSAATLQYLGEIAYSAGDSQQAAEQWSESRQLFASAGLVDRAQQVSQRLRDLGR